MKKLHSELLLTLIVALWGLSFSLAKPLLSKIGVFNFLSYRFIIGGLLLVVILLVRKKFKVNKEILRSGILSGAMLFVVFYCHFEGLKHTTIAKNSFIVGSSVIYIPFILYIFYKKKSSLMIMIQTAIAISGLALITMIGGSASLNYGDIITLIGTVVYAFYIIMVEDSVKKYNTNVFTAIQLSTVGVLSLVATLAFETVSFDFTVAEWSNIGFQAIALTGVAFYLINLIQKNLGASNVTLIFTLEPFFATLFGWMFLKEYISKNVIAGGVLILLAVTVPYIKDLYTKKWRKYDKTIKVDYTVKSQ